MISFEEALSMVVDQSLPLARKTLPLGAAAGHFLATPVVALVNSPPANVSAMDGYAASSGNLPTLKLVGVSYPGAGFDGTLGQGECVRIFTGAPVPEGADRVIVQEIVEKDGEQILVVGEPGPRSHIRLRGSDFSSGEQLLPAGRSLDARALVAAAAADVATVEVWRRPRVAVLGTGDELAEPGKARATPGSVPESVSLGVSAIVEQYGGECISRTRVPDDPAVLKYTAVQALHAADLVVVTGGASVGEKDYAKRVFAELGLKHAFTKVAIKPGKPVWLGKVGGKLVFGLPGNPTSALVTARLLLAPLIRGLAGGDSRSAVQWQQAPLLEAMQAGDDRETFVRGRWRGASVEALRNQDSGAQRALAEAELLIRRRAGAPATAAGEKVEIIEF